MYNRMDKRTGLSNECPFCNFKQNGAKWLETIRDVNEYETSISNTDRIAVASKCPCCERLSWAHYDKNIIEAVRHDKKTLNDYIEYYEKCIPYI